MSMEREMLAGEEGKEKKTAPAILDRDGSLIGIPRKKKVIQGTASLAAT